LTYLKTRAVADALGVPYHRLFELLRSRKIAPPPKDSSGDYVWLSEHVEAARQALTAGRRKPAVAEGVVVG
jgi:hypothetical protein